MSPENVASSNVISISRVQRPALDVRLGLKLLRLCLPCALFALRFDTALFRYPPLEDIGERGNIAAGVDHFHNASSRITDRSIDNSSITNRCFAPAAVFVPSFSSLSCSLSAFISELDRKSSARGLAFSFDHDAAVVDEASAAEQAARTFARPTRAAQILPKSSKQAVSPRADFEDARDGLGRDGRDGAAAVASRDGVTMKFVKATTSNPAAAYAKKDAASKKQFQ